MIKTQTKSVNKIDQMLKLHIRPLDRNWNQKQNCEPCFTSQSNNLLEFDLYFMILLCNMGKQCSQWFLFKCIVSRIKIYEFIFFWKCSYFKFQNAITPLFVLAMFLWEKVSCCWSLLSSICLCSYISTNNFCSRHVLFHAWLLICLLLQEVDIWSYGCLLYELLTLQLPYRENSEQEIYDLLRVSKILS